MERNKGRNLGVGTNTETAEEQWPLAFPLACLPASGWHHLWWARAPGGLKGNDPQREWHCWEVWPCWRKSVTVGAGSAVGAGSEFSFLRLHSV